MKAPSLIIFIPVCLCFLAVLWSLIWYYSPWRKLRIARQKEYESTYKRIETIIDKCVVNQMNYDWILTLLHHLGQLPHKNHEKTENLSVMFWRKFKGHAESDVEDVLEIIYKN